MIPALGGAAVSLAVTWGLARLWRQRGWGDGPGGPDGERKIQGSPVPAVGGLAIALGWLVTAGLGGLSGADFGLVLPGQLEVQGAFGGWLEGPLGAWVIPAVLALALATGALDDGLAGGLSPGSKLLCQGATGALLALHDPTLGVLALALFLSMLYQNGLNTFDNADGACAGLSGVGLLLAASPLAPAVLIFLLPNLVRHRGTGLLRKAGPGDPIAYLGDGGSQLLGMVVLLTPGAWPVLVLPLLDLVHVSWLRIRAGRGPWEGDRRHLAHRLGRAGLGPVTVTVTLVGLALPVLLWPGAWGALGTGGAFALACFQTREHGEPHPPAEIPLDSPH